MTFTIVARCSESGQAGVALATVSIAAGGLCPFYTSAGDIVVSQAYANRDTGLAVMLALRAGVAHEVHALRHLHTVHGVYAGYSDRREDDPPNAGSIVGCEAERLRQGGEFARRPSVFR